MEVFLTDESQVVEGASYKVCGDLDRLETLWEASNLGSLERSDLREFLNKIVKATETRLTQQKNSHSRVALEPGVVQCRSAKQGKVLYFPVKCLSRVDTMTGDAVDPAGNKIQQTGGAKKPVYFHDINDIKENEFYRITSSLEKLKKEWANCQLEYLTISKLRNLLRKFVKVEKVEPEYNACLCSVDHSDDLTYIPFNCLLDPDKNNLSSSNSRVGSTKPSKPTDGGGSSVKSDPENLTFADVIRGRKYKVTSDINFLTQEWERAGLDAFVELEYFLKVDGRCTDMDIHDETVKLSWKTGSEEEWFPATVLSLSGSKANFASESSKSESESKKNQQSLAEAAANEGRQRNKDMDYLDQVYKSSGVEYVTDATDAARGRLYEVTGDIARMERCWRESKFDDVERDFLRRFLKREVRVIQIEIADQTVQVRLEDTMDNVWLPAKVLAKLKPGEEKPVDRRRPEKSAELFRVGDDVRLVRVARQDYENCRGRLVEYVPAKEKWRVHLEYWDKIVVVRPINIVKDREDQGIQDLSQIELGAYYKVTTDYQLLVHSLEQMGENINNDSTEFLVEMLGELVHTKSIDQSSASVECVFDDGETKFLPFYILYSPDNRERPQEHEDLRDAIGYL